MAWRYKGPAASHLRIGHNLRASFSRLLQSLPADAMAGQCMHLLGAKQHSFSWTDMIIKMLRSKVLTRGCASRARLAGLP